MSWERRSSGDALPEDRRDIGANELPEDRRAIGANALPEDRRATSCNPQARAGGPSAGASARW